MPYDEADAWIETMMQMPVPPRMELPEELRLQEIEAERQPIGTRSRNPRKPGMLRISWVKCPLDYLGHVIGESDPATGTALISDEKKDTAES